MSAGGFRFLLNYHGVGCVAMSDAAAPLLLKLWPRNAHAREIAALALDESGETVNGPYSLIDKDHPNNGNLSA